MLAKPILVVGVVVAIFGAVLCLNVLSLRDLVLETGLPPAIAVVLDGRDEMSRRRAQGLEFLTGLAGVVVVLGAAVWLRTSRRGSRG